ncbi:class I SAM-dependent methyltransferase [Kitasatospora sp. HPMI-4]|uniref:class I SAM-dependent methyltransferase n=1 Tax=Kitasatospora sp. HPMI-4 TaxID=3448443 RepID=UPI003F19322D
MSFDADAFKAGQRNNWNDLSSGWDKWYDLFETGAAPATGALLQAAGIVSGSSVLDIGSGTGQPALAAAALVGPSGRVVGVDQAGQMLTIARRRAEELGLSNIEFLEQDAEQLDVPEDSFDAAISRWSLMFLPDVDRTLRSVHRALRPGGVLSATVWGPAPQVPLLSMAFGIAAARLGLAAPPPGTPGPFSMSDPERVAEQLAAAGFCEVRVDRCPLVFTVSSAEEFADFSWDLLPSWLKKSLVTQYGDEHDPRTKATVIAAAREFESDLGGLRVPCLSHRVRAVRA